MKVTVIKKGVSDVKVNGPRGACPWVMDAPPVGNEK
jgi:hypothetical protein